MNPVCIIVSASACHKALSDRRRGTANKAVGKAIGALKLHKPDNKDLTHRLTVHRNNASNKLQSYLARISQRRGRGVFEISHFSYYRGGAHVELPEVQANCSKNGTLLEGT